VRGEGQRLRVNTENGDAARRLGSVTLDCEELGR
jgi:hypothetical protein